jgi:hypothetical protein
MPANGFFSPGVWLIEQLAADEFGINPIRAQIAHIHGRREGCKTASL